MVKPVNSKRKLFSSSKDQKENTPQSPTDTSPKSSKFIPSDKHLKSKRKGGQDLQSPRGSNSASCSLLTSPTNNAEINEASGTANNIHGRPYSMPMSERQQIALLLQLSSPSSNKCVKSSKDSTPTQVTAPPCDNPGTPQLKSKFEGDPTPTMSAGRCGVGKRNERGETPLHVAAIRGDAERVAQLIQRGSDVNAVDYAGWTALHEACNRGFVSVAQELISAGASVNAKGLDNDTPLHDACVNNHFKLVEVLLENGASTSVVNRNGHTPADVCRSPVILSLLHKANKTQGKDLPPTPKMSSRRSPTTTSTSKDMKESKESTSPKESEEGGGSSSTPTSSHDTSTASTATSSTSTTTTSTTSTGGSTVSSNSNPSSPRVTLRLSQSTPRGNEKTNRSDAKLSESSTDDPYEFKCSKDESVSGNNTPTASESTGSSQSTKPSTEAEDKESSNKRSLEEEEGEEGGKRKKRKEEPNNSLLLNKESKTLSRSNRAPGEKHSNKPMARPSTTPSTSSQTTQSTSKSLTTSSPSSSSVVTSQESRKSPVQSNSPKGSIKHEDGPQEEETSSGGPKVPPLKIVLSGGGGTTTSGSNGTPTASQDQDQKGSSTQQGTKGSSSTLGSSTSTAGSTSKASGTSKNLPYVMSSDSKDSKDQEKDSDTKEGVKESYKEPLGVKDEPASPCGSTGSTSAPPRVTRSQRGSGNNAEESTVSQAKSEVKVEVKQEESNPPTSSHSTPNHSSLSTSETTNVHHRKRKLNIKEESSEGTDTPEGTNTSGTDTNQPVSNCYQMYMKIRKQIDDRRKLQYPVQAKAPNGYNDYVMIRGAYVLAGNKEAESVVRLEAPPNLHSALKELFEEQEKDRYKLRLQHRVERDRLFITIEQEICRVHGRAARAQTNQVLPFSACTLLREQEVYNILTPEQEEKHRSQRNRYNGRLFISWLQDVDDKWEKIKTTFILRQQNEAESLVAVQRMIWEWKLKELGMWDNSKKTDKIDELHVPMVKVDTL